MTKVSVWLLALALTAIGAAGTIGYGYQKANDEGINGTVNIITSQSIGMGEMGFCTIGDDDSGVVVIAEDGMSYLVTLQIENGDTVCINLSLTNYAKNTMIMKLTQESLAVDIDVWYREADGPENANTVGQIDPWTYLIKVKGTDGTGTVPACQVFTMCVEVGQYVEPGFYTFHTFVEPTNWGTLFTP